MKVVNITYDDYANLMYDMTEAMKTAGVDVEAYKLVPHPFAYRRQCPVIHIEDLRDKCERADIIQVFHTAVNCWDIAKKYKGRKLLTAWHTGSRYRNDPTAMNDYFKEADKVFTDQCEFMYIGYNETKWHYMATAVNTDLIFDTKRISRTPVMVAHYPSNPVVKGTATISSIFRQADKAGRMVCTADGSKVDHAENLRRMATCHIYVELFQPLLHGNPYGCYGVTAFEAASMGKVVITQNIYPNVYEKAYGMNGEFIICNTEKDLLATLNEYAMMHVRDIAEKQHRTRRWIVETHSYKPTGERIKKLLSGV